jgi:hypothetical protein
LQSIYQHWASPIFLDTNTGSDKYPCNQQGKTFQDVLILFGHFFSVQRVAGCARVFCGGGALAKSVCRQLVGIQTFQIPLSPCYVLVASPAAAAHDLEGFQKHRFPSVLYALIIPFASVSQCIKQPGRTGST